MKEETKEVVVDITLMILQIIARIPEATIRAFVDQKSLHNYFQKEGLFVDNFFQNLRSIERRGYIKISKISSETSVKLLNKGKIKILESSNESQTDGKWRFLSFDIPEKMKVTRDQFRRSIKRIGFKKIQKSLWATPFVKADEIDLIVNELNIREYVGYFVVEKSNLDKHLKKLFQKS